MAISRTGDQISFEAIGTHWQIDVYDKRAQKIERAALFKEIRERIEEFDRTYSRFRDDTLVSAMARAAGTYTLPFDAQPLMDLYLSLYQATGGAFTPLIGDTLAEAGYDAQYSLPPGSAPHAACVG
ncbi:MAG: FAD:protein FMN transferase [Patescibacteria group bacterium]